MNNAIKTIKEAAAIATELVGKKSGYRLNNNLHDYVTEVLSSPARVISVKGASGSGKTVGATLLRLIYQEEGYEVFDIRPVSPNDNYFWAMSNDHPLPDNHTGACSPDEMRIKASVGEKKIWILDEWNSFTSTQKKFILELINAFNLRAIIISSCEFGVNLQIGKIFVTPIY